MGFEKLGLKDELIEALKKENIENPTKVQEKALPSILSGADCIIQSETGSGKTLAYLLPLYQQLLPLQKGMKILVLVPTHELAMQVHRQVGRLSKNSGNEIKSAVIVGDVNIKRQIEALKEKPQIVIGTVGRILELIKKRKISAHTIETIVIDEADKLLDKNNSESTKAVVKCCMRDTRILLVSASIKDKMKEETKVWGKDFKFLKTSQKLEIPSNIQHMYFVAERRDKVDMLRKLASSMQPKKAMVFINKLSQIEEATKKLQYHHYNAECIHGSNMKEDRKKVIQDFANGELQFLIATDIAARGLHFDNVDVVLHLSIPEDPMDYLHRAGRTGRNGEKGINVLIVTKEELKRVNSYQKAFGVQIMPKKLFQGKIVRESSKKS